MKRYERAAALTYYGLHDQALKATMSPSMPSNQLVVQATEMGATQLPRRCTAYRTNSVDKGRANVIY